MKKIFCAALLCGTVIQTSYAQTEKGTQNLGLSFSVFSSKSNSTEFDSYNNVSYEAETKNTLYSIAPSYSYFIADKLDIGISAGYSSSTSKYTINANLAPSQTDRTVTGAVFLRKYILFNDKIGVRTGPSFQYARGKQTQNYPDSYPVSEISYNTDTYRGGVQLDFVYFPMQKLALAAGVGNIYYTHQKTDESQPTTNNTFQVNFVNSLYFSFYYIF